MDDNTHHLTPSKMKLMFNRLLDICQIKIKVVWLLIHALNVKMLIKAFMYTWCVFLPLQYYVTVTVVTLWSKTYFILTCVVSVLQLFSSGIYCQDSPRFDDLFGFSVKDVLDEVKRGSKLVKIKDIIPTWKSSVY